MQLVRTHQSRPSAAPQIQEAAMVNSSTAFISWSPIKDEHHNGPLTGYQVRFLPRRVVFCYIGRADKHPFR